LAANSATCFDVSVPRASNADPDLIGFALLLAHPAPIAVATTVGGRATEAHLRRFPQFA